MEDEADKAALIAEYQSNLRYSGGSVCGHRCSVVDIGHVGEPVDWTCLLGQGQLAFSYTVAEGRPGCMGGE